MKEKSIIALFLLALAMPTFAQQDDGGDSGTACEPGQCASVPEPSTLGLFVAAALGALVLRRLKK